MNITINYGAIIGAAVVNVAVGALWYGPVFGRTWRRMMKFTDEDMRSMPLTPWQAMFGGVVTALIMAFVLSQIATQGTPALTLAFWPWIGFVAPIQAGGWLWEGKSFTLFAFNAAASFVSLLAMAIVLTLAV
jgi:hypothetical protein